MSNNVHPQHVLMLASMERSPKSHCPWRKRKQRRMDRIVYMTVAKERGRTMRYGC